MKDKCFANKRGRCKVLNVNVCEGSSCSFYKTEEQFNVDRLKALKRIRTLDKHIKQSIIDTYYKGNKKFLEEELL